MDSNRIFNLQIVAVKYFIYNLNITLRKYAGDESVRAISNNKNQTLSHKIGQTVLSLYFIVMAVVYPYYAPGGYLRIGEAKYIFFRNVTLAVMAAMLVVVLCTVIRRPGLFTEYYHRMSVTDWFAYGYFVAVMLSYLGSSYKEEAFWGAEGWYMGTVMQMMLVLLYFFFSRYFVCRISWLAVWMLASAGVFLLGILNRYSIYPVAMEGQTPVFISTLGNINWFCGYWSVTAPIGITLYWCSEKRWQRAAAGLYSIVAMLAGVVQGSGSAYLVFGAVFVALLLFSLHNIQRLYRWLELGMLFAAGCQLGRILRYLPGFCMNYGGDVNGGDPLVMERLTDSNVTLWGLGILWAVYVGLRLWERKKGLTDDKRLRPLHKKGLGKTAGIVKTAEKVRTAESAKTGNVTRILIVILIVCICLWGLIKTVRLLYNMADESVPGQDSQGIVSDEGRADSQINWFHDDWGNGRGTAWNCSIEAYRGLDTMHKIVGVGPDCFAAYLYEVPELAGRLMEQFGDERLTNAHNEGLSILINMGALGFLCYVGFVGSALVRYNRNAGRQPFFYVCAICLLAYTVHNMVSFQQVLNTPYFFMLLGIGEGLLRENREKL